jgi:hypothetical protein
VPAGFGFDDDGRDALQVEQVREQESRGTCADDANLGAECVRRARG